MLTKKSMINKSVSFFLIILFCSFPISMTGIEIGRFGLLLCLIAIFFFIIVKKVKKNQLVLGESPFSLISTDVFSSYKTNFNGVEHYLRRILPAIFLLYCFLYTLSFLTTPHWGGSDSGSLDYIFPFFLPSIAAWLSYKYFNPDSLRKIIPYLLLFFLASHLYSFYGVFIKGHSRAIGFYHYHTVYARILSVEYTIIMVLIFHNFQKWITMSKRKKMPWAFLFLIFLLILFFYDMSLNKSRVLVMVVLIIPILLFLFYNLKHIKRLIFLPVIFFICFIFLNQLIESGTLHHFNFYHKSPLPINITEKEGVLELSILDRISFHKMCHLEGESYPFQMNVRLLDEKTNKLLYNGEFVKKYLLGKELKEGDKKTYFFEFDYSQNSPGFMNTLLIIIAKNKNNYDVQVVEAFNRINLKRKSFKDLASGYSFSHLRMDFFQPSRTRVYKSTLSMINKNPYMGNGPGTWRDFVTNIEHNDYAHHYRHSPDNKLYHSHNNFLQVFYDSGLITLIVLFLFLTLLFLVNILFLFRNEKSKNRHSQYVIYLIIFFCFITLHICGIFDITFYETVPGAFFWSLMGILMKP